MTCQICLILFQQQLDHEQSSRRHPSLLPSWRPLVAVGVRISMFVFWDRTLQPTKIDRLKKTTSAEFDIRIAFVLQHRLMKGPSNADALSCLPVDPWFLVGHEWGAIVHVRSFSCWRLRRSRIATNQVRWRQVLMGADTEARSRHWGCGVAMEIDREQLLTRYKVVREFWVAFQNGKVSVK